MRMPNRVTLILRVAGIGLIFFHVATIVQDVTVAYAPGPPIVYGPPLPSGSIIPSKPIQRPHLPTASMPPPKSVQLSSQGLVIVAVDLANVRSSPNIAASVLAQVKYGTELHIIDQRADWFKVKLPDQSEGWVAAGWVVAAGQPAGMGPPPPFKSSPTHPTCKTPS